MRHATTYSAATTFRQLGLLLLLAVFSLPLTHCAGSKGLSLSKSKEKTLDDCSLLSRKKKYEEAIQCFEAYRSRHAGSTAAAEADLAIADAYFSQKDYIVASEAYNIFTESHPYHGKAPYAYLRAGISYLKQAPKTVDRDQTALEGALKNLNVVLSSFPTSSYAAEAKQYHDIVRARLAKQHYYVGRFYYKTGEYLAAIPRFETVITEFNQLGMEDKSFYYLIRALQKTRQTDVAQRYFEAYKKYYPERTNVIKKIDALF